MGVSLGLAKPALEVSFDDLPGDVVHQTRRLVLDTLGCAIGGFASSESSIIQEVVGESGHPAEATVFGSRIKTSCQNWSGSSMV